nr:transposase [Mesomycoplasma ovipneumoniae]
MLKCVVHQIRNSLLKVSNKDKKEFVFDMKKIYQESAMQNLDEFAKKWGKNILQLSSLGMEISLN